MKKIKISDRQKENIVEILKTVFLCLLIFNVFLSVKAYFFQVVSVKGDSMNPAICEKDVLLINKFSDKNSFDRYDIIVFKPYTADDAETPDEDESKMLYIKRIIGLPGETVTILKDGSIRITDKNGAAEILSDDVFGSSVMNRGINWQLDDDNIFETVTLAEDEFFVLGDNREVSLDSRSVKVQAVHESSILGKYTARIYPFHR